MSNVITTGTDRYYNSLDDIKADGLSPVKCTSLVQFYKLDGRKSVISKENLVPITYLQYVYFSKAENRYSLRCFPNWDIKEFYLNHRAHMKHRLRDEARIPLMEDLSNKVFSGNVWLLFNPQQIKDTSSMLERVWNTQRSDKGKLQYKDWITIAEIVLKKEDFELHQSGVTGYKTTINIMESRITEFWLQAKNNAK